MNEQALRNAIRGSRDFLERQRLFKQLWHLENTRQGEGQLARGPSAESSNKRPEQHDRGYAPVG